MRADDGDKFHIFRAQMQAGQYTSVTPAPFTDARFGDVDPAVAPDESFVIFSSSSMRDGQAPSSTDLFISFRMEHGWSRPLDLRQAISPRVHGVEARLSPDSATLYFTNSDGPSGPSGQSESYIWSVRLNLKNLRLKSIS
jgi:Tol biopolymer transport system component